MKRPIHTLFLYLIPLLVFVPIYILRDYTPNNELRYVSIVDEALNNSSVLVFYNHGEPYADKPPLYLWIMMIGRLIAGDHLLIFMGMVNLIIVFLIMWIMNHWCFREQNATTILPPMLTLLTTGLFTGAFLVMRMDILMTLFIILALYTFYKLYEGKGSRDDEWLLPLYLFLAVFTKGALGLLIPVVAIALFLIIRKEGRLLGYYLGLRTWGVLLALCAIWFAGVYAEGGKNYLSNLLFHQTINRAIDSFHHKEPFYFYLMRFWLLAAPWSLLGIAVLFEGFRKKVIGKYPLLQFFVVVMLSTFVLLSFISSKIDIYLLPVYPFFIYFTFVVLQDLKADLLIRLSVMIPIILLCAAIPILLYVARLFPAQIYSYSLLLVGGIVLTAGGVWAFLLLRKGRIISSIGICTAVLLAFIFINSFQIPAFNNYLGMRGIANEAKKLGIEHQTSRYASLGIGRAENMEVYLGVPVHKIDSLLLPPHPAALPTPYILLSRIKEIERNKILQKELQNKERRIAGKYVVYVID